MFEPKIYNRNGLEAFRLLGSDGSEFFYEGALDCDEKVLYKDTLGRLYYQVIAEIGGTVKYYVELDPQVTPIPFAAEDARAKMISRLVNASPRPDASLPEDIFVKPGAPQEEPQEVPLDLPRAAPEASEPQAAPPEAAPVEPVKAEEPAEQPAEVPPAVEPEHVKSPEAASAIHAVFSPKVDTLHPAVEDAAPAEQALPESEPAPVVKTAEQPVKPPKKRSLKWPLAIGAILVILLAIAAGVYFVKPHTYDGLKSMLKGATPTPSPAPTVTPSPTPEPTPTPLPDEGTPGTSISELIDSDNAAVAAFGLAHLNESSANNTLRKACDLFDYVNGHWKYTGDYPTPRKASEIAYTLQGNSRDYTVLMTALLKSQGIPCRVVFSYPGGRSVPDYYPEVLAANTSTAYQTIMQQLHVWYGIVSPQGHQDDSGNWVALSIGSTPGVRPGDAVKEFALNGMTITQLK